MSKMKETLEIVAEDYAEKNGMDITEAFDILQHKTLGWILEQYDAIMAKKNDVCWYTIVFNKSNAEWYENENHPDNAWSYNVEFVDATLSTIALYMKAQGYYYLRELYFRFGGDGLSISPILGWDKEQNPEFKYEVVEDKENDQIIIKVNPKTLK